MCLVILLLFSDAWDGAFKFTRLLWFCLYCCTEGEITPIIPETNINRGIQPSDVILLNNSHVILLFIKQKQTKNYDQIYFELSQVGFIFIQT